MNISGNFSVSSTNRYISNKEKAKTNVSTDTKKYNTVSFGRSPLVNLYLLDQICAAGQPHKSSQKTPQKSDEVSSSNSTYTDTSYEESLEKYKKEALDNEIIIKNIQKNQYSFFGPKLVEVEIDGKDYNFYCYVDNECEANKKATYAISPETGRKNRSWHFNRNDLDILIKNVKDQHRGKFVTINNKDVFIPFVKNGKPDITKDSNLVQYGNYELANENTGLYVLGSLDFIEEATGKKLSPKDFKVIEYVEKTENPFETEYRGEENDNIERKQAFGYYDPYTETSYLYFANRDEPQKLITKDRHGKVKTFEQP